ncbi:transposase [Cylindrospermopsis raciborskii]|uniref:transposase n=1 Tax=Cylindrospermopsis raciborskii TaxID=77022 RepID=UPI001F0F5FB2
MFNSLANRKRGPGGGRKPTLRSIEEKLFYILLYCKCYPTFDLLSVLFNFDRSCAHDWVHRLLSVLETTLGEKQVLPARKLRSMEEFTERFPDVKEVIVDGTERPVQRPQNRERQKEYYSGKKKRHTCKQITVSTKKPKGIEARRHGGGMGQFL